MIKLSGFMNKKLILLLMLMLCSVAGWAQQGIIKDVTFSQRDGKVMVSYYLDLQRSPKMRNVKAYIIVNGASTELKYVAGDVGTVVSSGRKYIEVDFFKQFDGEDVEGNIRFQVRGQGTYVKPTSTIEYVYSPTAPIGFTYAYCGRRWGGYLNMKFGLVGNSKIEHSEYNSDIVVGDRAGYSRTDIIVGPVVRLHKLVYLYAGIGYGNYQVVHKYQDAESNFYYQYKFFGADQRKGMAYEVGARVVLSKLVSVSVGYNSILGGGTPVFSDFHVGLGFTF